VDELDRHRPLADRRGDALDRAGAHVPRREHAGPAGLQQDGDTGGSPMARRTGWRRPKRPPDS
jgi:hypothetical protein